MKRLSLLFVLFVLCLGLIPLAMSFAKASSNVSSASLLPGVAGGYTYGGYLSTQAGSSVASVGPLFPASLGCALSTKTVSASGASLNLGGFASSGTVADTVQTTRTSTSVSVHTTSTVQSVSILTGLITATTVRASVSSNATKTSASSDNSTTFTNLVVAGIPITGTPAPNTTISLPGLGKVVLNEQAGPTNSANATSIAVNAIDVSVTLSNPFGLPVGSHIVIAHADSSFVRTSILASLSGGSYGLYAFGNAGSGFASSGPWAPAGIGCTGGNVTVSIAGVTISSVATTGTITDTASGKISSTGPTGSSSSTVQEVNILSGLIVAATVSTSARASVIGGKGSASATTTLANASVNGITLSANPTPNTKINIANLGYVVVNEQILSTTSSSASALAVAFDLYVTTSNSFGLPVGVRIIVGRSLAFATTSPSATAPSIS